MKSPFERHPGLPFEFLSKRGFAGIPGAASSSSSSVSTFPWSAVLAFGLVSAGLLGAYQYLSSKKNPVSTTKTETIGMPDIGGPFTLVNHHGKPVTDLDFRGKYLMIYFGFTFCPDICPTELRKMAQVMTDLRKMGGLDAQIQPLFISVDPWRDTVEQIRGYITEFHPSFLGLTGTPEQVMKVAKAYRVYSSRPFQVQPGSQEERDQEEEDEDQDYLVDHTIFIYFMDPRGKLIDFYGQNKPADEITQSVYKHIKTPTL